MHSGLKSVNLYLQLKPFCDIQSGPVWIYLINVLKRNKIIKNTLFRYLRLFNTIDSKQMCCVKICRWLDLNLQPLVLEAAALPTEP